MSAQAVAWAMDARQTGQLAPTARLVLATMADYADPTGRGVWVVNQTIAARLGLGVRVVQRARRELEDAKLIFAGDQALTEHIRGDRRPPVYDLAVAGVQVVIVATGEVVELGEEPYTEDPHGVSDPTPRTVDNPGSRGVENDTPSKSRGVGSDAHGVSDPTPKPRTEPTTTNSPDLSGDRSAREEPNVDNLHCHGCGKLIRQSHHCRAANVPPDPVDIVDAGPDLFAAAVAAPAPARRGDCTLCGTAGAVIADTERGWCFRCLYAHTNPGAQLGRPAPARPEAASS